MSSNLYFAYGSNLCAARLRELAPSALARGAAQAHGFALRLDKRGVDGTAKANLHPAPGGVVWGAVYALDPADWARLDARERDYARIEIEIVQGDQRALAQTYRSDRLTEAAAGGLVQAADRRWRARARAARGVVRVARRAARALARPTCLPARPPDRIIVS